jgi:sulfofructose kinase
VDRFGIPGMIRAARIARAAGIPVVADFESSHLPRFNELLALSDHLILSDGFARKITRTGNPRAAALRLWSRDRATVIITCGARGCWFLGAGMKAPQRWPAFDVETRDTTGCGDVFHGAYATALARGEDLNGRLRVASAAAALKATQHGGQAGIPTEREVRRFLDRRSRRSGRVEA